MADTFIKLWQVKPDFLSMEKLRAWMLTAIHHAGINFLKTLSRHDASHRELRMQANIDIDLDFDLRLPPLERFQQAMASYGLRLIQSERAIEVLVISDQQ